MLRYFQEYSTTLLQSISMHQMCGYAFIKDKMYITLIIAVFSVQH